MPATGQSGHCLSRIDPHDASLAFASDRMIDNNQGRSLRYGVGKGCWRRWAR